MFNWMMRKPDLKAVQLRDAHLRRLAKVLEVSNQEPFTGKAPYRPRGKYATTPMLLVESGPAQPVDR